MTYTGPWMKLRGIHQGSKDVTIEKKISNQPFLRSSGLPFLTVAKTISPLAAAGSRFNRPRIPPTAMIYKFFAPVIIKDSLRSMDLHAT